MAIINMSVDTKTRVVSVMVDGVLVPYTECHLSKYQMGDGEHIVNCSYTIESQLEGGLTERRMFYLASPKESTGGMESKVLLNMDKVREDIDRTFRR